MVENNIEETLWNGLIPLQIDCSIFDIASIEIPHPYFVLVPRTSYLPVALEEAIEYFRAFVIEFRSDVWFQYQDIPLKCNLPIGVLFDLFTYSSVGDKLPWKLTIRFQEYPFDKILRCSTSFVCEKFYNHSLKQALYLLHGNVRSFNSLSAEDQSQIWTSSKTSNFILFSEISKNLIPPLDILRNIPIRLIRKNHPMIQQLAQPYTYRPQSTSSSASSLQNQQIGIDNNNEETSNLKISSSPSLATLEEVLTNFLQDSTQPKRCQCIAQGVPLPPNAPLWEVWMLLKHPDLFLYLSLIED